MKDGNEIEIRDERHAIPRMKREGSMHLVPAPVQPPGSREPTKHRPVIIIQERSVDVIILEDGTVLWSHLSSGLV
jgi:hypothetical protein